MGQLASHIAVNYPLSRIALELFNEPHVPDSGYSNGSTWAAIQTEIYRAARNAAPALLIVLTGDDWGSGHGLSHIIPVEDGAPVAYSFHFYEPMPFTHQGATWGWSLLQYFKGLTYPCDAADAAAVEPVILASAPDNTTRDQLKSQLDWLGATVVNSTRLQGWMSYVTAWAAAYPQERVLLGEFGVFRQYAPPEGRAAWIRDVRKITESFGWGWCHWESNRGFGLFNGDQPNMAIFDALIDRDATTSVTPIFTTSISMLD